MRDLFQVYKRAAQNTQKRRHLSTQDWNNDLKCSSLTAKEKYPLFAQPSQEKQDFHHCTKCLLCAETDECSRIEQKPVRNTGTLIQNVSICLAADFAGRRKRGDNTGMRFLQKADLELQIAGINGPGLPGANENLPSCDREYCAQFLDAQQPA